MRKQRSLLCCPSAAAGTNVPERPKPAARRQESANGTFPMTGKGKAIEKFLVSEDPERLVEKRRELPGEECLEPGSTHGEDTSKAVVDGGP